MIIRTRFSPSPTGMIHLGNARAALFSAFYAAKHHGTFILRIEDTDATRSELHHIESLQNDLHWLTINWQEGPGENGQYGPYLQSQRQNIYAKYYKVLEDKKQIYPCFCTDQALMLARKIQLSRGQAPRYAGTCRQLTQDEINELLQQGKKPAWRFAVAAHETIEFTDAVKGLQQFNTDDIGDFIVRRADGTAPFLFCNAIDDAEMKVTQVLRGEDHLANTPRQILLLNTLGLTIPQYGHLSLIVGDDGTPLSKRHGSFSVNDFREQGYLPIAIINYLARLGHHCDSQDLLNFDELAKHFNLDKLSRSSARFDSAQLMFWQKTAVQAMDLSSFWKWIGVRIESKIPDEKRTLFAETVKTNIEFPRDADAWADIFFSDDMFMEEKELTIIHEAGEQFFVEAEQAVDKYGTDFASVLSDMKQTLHLQGKKLFMPLRVALTGKTHGPELAHIAELLGIKKIKSRLGTAFKFAIENGAR